MDGEPGFLSGARVAIIGFGLIGGSLALALKDRCAQILGCDPDEETRRLALEAGAADRMTDSPAEILAQAGLIVLAAPVRSILALLGDLPDLCPQAAVVIDLGSTKTEILHAMAALPERFDPIGGHPMAGKETSGFAQAEADLFRNAPFAIVPLERTSARARQIAADLAQAVGAHPVWMDTETHDRWTAATSHLPYLIACALSLATPRESAPLVGPGLRSTTRVAASSPRMMLDILRTNRENVLDGLESFRSHIDEIESLLRSEGWAELEQLLSTAAAQHAALTSNTGGVL